MQGQEQDQAEQLTESALTLEAPSAGTTHTSQLTLSAIMYS